MAQLNANLERRHASFDFSGLSSDSATRRISFDPGADNMIPDLSRNHSGSPISSPWPPSPSTSVGRASRSPRCRPMTAGGPSSGSPRGAQGSPATATRDSSRNLVESLRAEVSQAEEMEKLRRARASAIGNVSPLLRATLSGIPSSRSSSFKSSPMSPLMSPFSSPSSRPLAAPRGSIPDMRGGESGISWTSKDGHGQSQSGLGGSDKRGGAAMRRPQKSRSFDQKGTSGSFELGWRSSTSPATSPLLKSKSASVGGLFSPMSGLNIGHVGCASPRSSTKLESGISPNSSSPNPPGSSASSPKPPGTKQQSHSSPSPRCSTIKVVPAAQHAVQAARPPQAAVGERRRASLVLGPSREAAPWAVDDALLAVFDSAEEIGSGKYGSVRRRFVNGKHVAIKGLKRKEVYDSRGVSAEEARRMLLNESELVSCLDHPNIVRVTALVKSRDGSRVFMMLEECEGNIRQVYALEEKKWRQANRGSTSHSNYGNYGEARWLPPPTAALKLCKELVASIKYLQCDLKHPMLHRDLCPENCLVSKEGTLKLSDFGSARLLTGDDKVEGGEVWGGKQGYLLTGGLGSLRYAAPETLGERCLDRSTSVSPDGRKVKDKVQKLVKKEWAEPETGFKACGMLLHYDQKSDIHSMAMMLFYIATSEAPLKHMSAIEAADHIKAGGRPDLALKQVSRMNEYSSLFTYTLEHCWAHEPEDRCSAMDAASYLQIDNGKSPSESALQGIAAKLGFATAL